MAVTSLVAAERITGTEEIKGEVGSEEGEGSSKKPDKQGVTSINPLYHITQKSHEEMTMIFQIVIHTNLIHGYCR